MKVLVIVDSIDKNHSSGAKANVALIENLAAIGYSLTIIHQSATDIHVKGASMRWAKPKKASLTYLLSRSQRVFTRITGWNINPTIEKWFGFSFTFFNDVTSFYSVAKKENPANFDWVLTLSYASSFRPHAAVLRLPHFHNKWLAYVHDPYPMHSYPRPYDWVEPGHQYKRNFFLKIAKQAKFMLYPSDYLAEWMEQYNEDAKGKRIIIPHQGNQEEFVNAKAVESPYIFKDTFVVLHSGSLMDARNPFGLIRGFQLFLEQNPDAQTNSKLLFVGIRSNFHQRIEAIQKNCPQILLSDGYVSFEETLEIQKQASVNVILEAIAYFSPFLPGKFTHCILAKKPLLLVGPFFSESKRLLGPDYPFWASNQDAEQIAIHLKSLYEKWKTESNYGYIREDLIHYLSKDYLKTTFDTLLK